MSAVPSTFGKYFLTEKIASGGMAEIYLAKLLGPGGFEKFLIIKKIHPELSGERQFVEMFVAEAKTLVSLSHGNIVPIYELGMVDESYFIAMEYIDGPTLEDLCRRARERGNSLSPAMAAYVCAELLKGLDYAHRKGEGVIHRDLSPRNVLISREGEVKLVDFGIAVAANLGDKHEGRPSGSYPHMSPEQVRGETLDGRSDVFAAGILLWEMLTGRALFAREGEEATLKAVTDDVIPPPSADCPKAAGVLDAICARALQRDLGERYRSAGEFLIAINRYLYSQVETVTPADISRFVAKTCPPSTAEFARPKSAALQTSAPERSGTVPIQRPERSGTVPIQRPERSGTVPVQRSGTVPIEPGGTGAQRAQGKRPETVRSFATNVNFKDVLASATPLLGVPAMPEAPEPLDEPGEDAGRAADSQPTSTASPSERNEASSARVASISSRTQQVPRQDASKSSRTLPLLLGSGVALGGIAIAAFVVGGSNKEQAAPLIATIDAGLFDAGRSDARALRSPRAADAAPAPDARAMPRDAAPVIRRRRADAREQADPGTLRIGASPWADVYLRGKKIGRAPGTFEVAAGSHQIELRYKNQSQIIPAQVEPGEMTSLGVIRFQVE